MTKKIATRIQHHPSRTAQAAELLERLDGLGAALVTDPGGQRTSSWRTHRLCLESLPDDASHLLVLQDDAWPCDGFADIARAAVDERPDTILCLFVPGFGHVTRRMELARKQRDRWMLWHTRAFVPLVAVVYPARFPRGIVEFSEKRKVHMGRADDAIVATFCRAHRLHVWATVPSLVQHRDELPSVMKMKHGRGAPHRLAAHYAHDGGAWATAVAGKEKAARGLSRIGSLAPSAPPV